MRDVIESVCWVSWFFANLAVELFDAAEFAVIEYFETW